jgi:NitT/TauT family transport system ATP-binding protein
MTASHASDATPAIAVHGASIRYGADRRDGGLLAVDDVSFEVQAGEFVSIVGPSGCGKSSLLRAVAGLLAPTAGAVSVLGDTPRRAQEEKRLGLVFQEPALLPWRNVRGNVQLPRDVNTTADSGGQPEIDELLRMVGLEAFAGYRPHELSGGMQQRVALARALAIDPDVLLMDEPFAALDEITRESMRYELLRIWSNAGAAKSVLFVTHSVAEAVALSDRVLVMSRQPGRILTEIDVHLPRPRQPEAERTPAFLDYTDQIRSLLRTELPAATELAASYE